MSSVKPVVAAPPDKDVDAGPPTEPEVGLTGAMQPSAAGRVAAGAGLEAGSDGGVWATWT